MHKDSILAQLRAHEAELKASGIASLSIFGSVARGDATDRSDVDVVVRLSPERSECGFAYFGQLDALTQRLQERYSAARSILSLSQFTRSGCGASSREMRRLPSEKQIQRFADILENFDRIERFTRLLGGWETRPRRLRPISRGRASAASATCCVMLMTALTRAS